MCWGEKAGRPDRGRRCYTGNGSHCLLAWVTNICQMSLDVRDSHHQSYAAFFKVFWLKEWQFLFLISIHSFHIYINRAPPSYVPNSLWVPPTWPPCPVVSSLFLANDPWMHPVLAGGCWWMLTWACVGNHSCHVFTGEVDLLLITLLPTLWLLHSFLPLSMISPEPWGQEFTQMSHVGLRIQWQELFHGSVIGDPAALASDTGDCGFIFSIKLSWMKN